MISQLTRKLLSKGGVRTIKMSDDSEIYLHTNDLKWEVNRIDSIITVNEISWMLDFTHIAGKC